VDTLLENGDKVMAVEIKNKPTLDGINGHVEHMEKLRSCADLYDDKRVYPGRALIPSRAVSDPFACRPPG
jgi:hypothetical protein